MPSIRYINQSAPFWDFVANLENQGATHPFAQQANAEGTEEAQHPGQAWGWGPWGGHRGHRGGFPHHHRGPPGPPHAHHHSEGEDVPPPPFEEKEGSPETEKGDVAEKGESSNEKTREGAPEGRHHGFGAGRQGHCGGRRGGPHKFGGRGPWGFNPRGGFPFGGPFGDLAGAFFGENATQDNSDEGTFKPDADVYDTEDSYIVELSLPGAKKEYLGIEWSAEKSELTVAGVVHRSGDEEFIKTLALDERKVGAFERKVRLGSRANPAQVDVDSMTAKLEDGILRIEISKLDKDYVQVKHVVDIE